MWSKTNSNAPEGRGVNRRRWSHSVLNHHTEGFKQKDYTMAPSAVSTLFLSTITCLQCGALGAPVVTPGTPPHPLRADCSDCGAFVQWLSRRSPEERAARRDAARQAAMRQKAPTAAQLAYLVALRDPQPAPTTMAEAAERISALLAKKGERP
jgi:hypothetical protein